MNNSKIVGMYRVKNEERFLPTSLESVRDVCDEIVVLDDGSTDQTVEICKSFNNVVDVHSQSETELDEVRDRNFLLNMALKRKPDYIISIDGDEVLMPFAKDLLLEELEILYPEKFVFEFQFLTCWDGGHQIRTDGIFGNYYQKRLFRVQHESSKLKFENTKNPGNLHCGSIPKSLPGFENPVRSKVKIFHLASIDESLRQQKFQYYTKIDPDNPLTDGYKHMISGEGKFSGANGIELQQLPKEFGILM